MPADSDILDLLRAESAEAARKAQRALLIQPGAIGDCILTLPLVSFIKKTLSLGGVDMLGHTDYVGIMPGRTCIDSVRSIDLIDIHRLFSDHKNFSLKDGDTLINTFSGYSWIVTFMGEQGSDFERNLIFTANCSQNTEVLTLLFKPPEDYSNHLSNFYIDQFITQSDIHIQSPDYESKECLIKNTKADINKGIELLKEAKIDLKRELVIIHPGSGALNKCWYTENFIAIAKKLLGKNFEVIFLLGPAEFERFDNTILRNLAQTTKCLSDISLPQVFSLLNHAKYFIGNDSGITHLAASSGVKTFVVFGPTKPSIYAPIGPDVNVFVVDTPDFAKKSTTVIQREILNKVLAGNDEKNQY